MCHLGQILGRGKGTCVACEASGQNTRATARIVWPPGRPIKKKTLPLVAVAEAEVRKGKCRKARDVGGGFQHRLVNVATWSYIRAMKTVGVRELKNRLSEYIRQVRAGEAVLVTDRGEVVAEIGPPGRAVLDDAVPPGLAALASRGLATLGAPGDAMLYPALPRGRRQRHRAAQLLEQERGDR